MLNETVLLMGRFLQINMLKCIERLSINQKSDKMIIDDNEMKGSVPIENIKKLAQILNLVKRVGQNLKRKSKKKASFKSSLLVLLS